jgi:hypothetical protein
MDTIVPNPDKNSQDLASLDNFSQESASLDKLAPEHQGFDVAESAQTTRQINREQAQQQLAALGYTFSAGDTVYLRGFYHPTDPRKKKDKGRKETATSLDKLIAHATRFQNEGRGIYFVVNGGGQKDDDVSTGRAIFYEHDNLDKAAQIELWKNLGLPEPSLQIDTGGKSIHSYWVFDEPVAVEKWRSLQTDLLEFADADRSIKNPSRVMRLAGAWHTSGNQSLIINNSGKRYTYDELREVIPEPKQPEAKQPKLQLEATSNKPNSYKEIEVPVSTPALGNFSQGSFDIRDHQDKLEPGKGDNFFTCPSCGGRRLGINPKTGAYKCWSGDCASADIREAIRPLAEFLAEVKDDRTFQPAIKPKATKKEYPPVPIPIGAKLLRLPAPGQSPHPEQLKDAPSRVPRNALQITYEYSPTQKVVRYEWPDATNPKGRDKTYSQFHIDPDGKKDWAKGDARWPAYQLAEVVETLKTLPNGQAVGVLTLEGEPNVELGRSHSIAGLTVQGSNWTESEIEAAVKELKATGKNVALVKLRDNDATGIKNANLVRSVCDRLQFPCVIIDPRKIYSDIPEKGDIREILEAIGADEFLNRVNAEIAAQAENPEPLLALEKALPFEPNTKYTQHLRRWKKSKVYTATVVSDSRFVDFLAPGPNTITFIKGGLGSGKTQRVAEVITAVTTGKIFLLGHRNALLRNTIKRFNETSKCKFYHIKYDDGEIMLLDPNGRVASCVDSLKKFMDDCADEDCTIILDEVESVVRHILAGGTISANDRMAILDKFTRLLNSCSRIILLDGHLTDATVAYIASLSPGKAITKYENTFKGGLPKVEIFRSSGAPLKASEIEAFTKDLILKAERPAVFCDSKDDAIAIYKQLEEVHGEGTGLLLTADTASEDWQAEFMDEPKESIKKYQWKFIVASPVAESGVDIPTEDYFSEAFGIFGGVVSVNSVCQMVRRVRHPINGIKILCVSRSRYSADGGDIYAARIQQLLLERLTADIAEFDERPEADIHAELLEQIKTCIHHKAWFNLKVLENLERPYFYEFVCELLRDSGHEVVELDIENAVTETHKQVKEEVRWEYAEAVANAKIIPIATADKILKKHEAKKDEILSATRAVYVDQLPGIEITSSLIHRLKKERNLLSGMRNLWYFQNPDKAKQLREYRWEEGKIKVFGSDHRKNSLILRTLLKLDIGKFLECERSFCNDSPEVLEVIKWGGTKEATTAGLKIANQSPIQYLQSLLAHLGIKLIGERKKGEQRRYSYKPECGSLPADFNELYAAVSAKMLQKWEEKVQKKEAEKRSTITPETLDNIDLEPIPPLTNFSYNNVVGGGTETEENLEAQIYQPEPEVESPIAQEAWAGSSASLESGLNAVCWSFLRAATS